MHPYTYAFLRHKVSSICDFCAVGPYDKTADSVTNRKKMASISRQRHFTFE